MSALGNMLARVRDAYQKGFYAQLDSDFIDEAAAELDKLHADLEDETKWACDYSEQVEKLTHLLAAKTVENAEMREGHKQIRAKSELWKHFNNTTPSTHAAPPWWHLGDISAAILAKYPEAKP